MSNIQVISSRAYVQKRMAIYDILNRNNFSVAIEINGRDAPMHKIRSTNIAYAISMDIDVCHMEKYVRYMSFMAAIQPNCLPDTSQPYRIRSNKCCCCKTTRHPGINKFRKEKN